MFGYVRPREGDLRVREYNCYRALYCGLCHSMGKCTGQCSRFSLNYDFVFLSMVRFCLSGESFEIEKKRCIAHPFRRRLTATDSETLRYCADASALLTYEKLNDDRSDERGMKKLRAVFARPLFSGAYRKAKRRHLELAQKIAGSLSELHKIENDPDSPPSADRPAACFGEITGAILAEGLTGDRARVAAHIGSAIGRWIYLADAADDYEADRKKHRFNPFLSLFGEAPTAEDWQGVRTSLLLTLADAEQGFALLGDPTVAEVRALLDNLLYLGMPDTAARLLADRLPESTDQTERKKA